MIYKIGGDRESSVEIGSFMYRLLMQEHVVSRGDALYGQHDPEEIILRVDSRQPLQRQVASTLHEALHAMDAQSRNELEEAQVTVLAMQMMGFMRDNPKLVADMMTVLA